jgi:molybdate-binding protein/DNA-binding transcriptional regulator YhcF (GntR family)
MTVASPLYQQLAEELAAAIQRGAYPPGGLLPAQRALAAERGLDVNTVNRAYRLLAQRGLVESHARRGTRVRARPSPPAVIASAATAIRCEGSHDFCLDVLARQLRQRGVTLALVPTGSSAGLQALAAGRADLAATHLLDDDGVGYNRDAVARTLPGWDIRLLTLVERQQGLIVPRGNPQRLGSVADIAGLRIVNRQAGSGTRLLLERLLQQAGIDLASLPGHERVVETHLAAAAAVAAGSADLALGLHAAARALDLDFVPLVLERFELAIPAAQLNAPWFGPLLEALAAPQFRSEVEMLGGYDAARSAWIRRVG